MTQREKANDEISDLRKELQSIVETKDDGEFAKKLMTFTKEKFRHTPMIRHGKWFPIKNEAKLSISDDGGIKFKSKDDSVLEIKDNSTVFLTQDGKWVQTMKDGVKSFATVTSTDNFVFVIEVEKETTSTLKRK